MSMGVDESMSEHINKMKELAGQLEAVGASITEEDQVAKLLCSLPDSYDSLITALESRGELSLEFVTARLLHEEHKRKETIPTSDCGEKALLSTKYDQVNPRNPKPKRKGKCHNSGIPAHWARECRKPKRGGSGEVKGKKDGSSYSATTKHA